MPKRKDNIDEPNRLTAVQQQVASERLSFETTTVRQGDVSLTKLHNKETNALLAKVKGNLPFIDRQFEQTRAHLAALKSIMPADDYFEAEAKLAALQAEYKTHFLNIILTPPLQTLDAVIPLANSLECIFIRVQLLSAQNECKSRLPSASTDAIKEALVFIISSIDQFNLELIDLQGSKDQKKSGVINLWSVAMLKSRLLSDAGYNVSAPDFNTERFDNLRIVYARLDKLSNDWPHLDSDARTIEFIKCRELAKKYGLISNRSHDVPEPATRILPPSPLGKKP